MQTYKRSRWTAVALTGVAALLSAAAWSLVGAGVEDESGYRDDRRSARSDADYDAEEDEGPPRNVRMTFLNESWPRVLNRVAEDSGSELVMRTSPRGRLNRMDRNRYTRREAVRILNRELEPEGFRLDENGKYLVLMNLEEARTKYKRPLVKQKDAQRPANRKPMGTLDVVEFPKLHREVHTIASRELPADRPSARFNSRSPQRTPRSTHRTVGHTEESPAEDAPQQTTSESTEKVSAAFDLRRRGAVEVAQVIYNTLKSRSRLIKAGPNGLPAFVIFEESAIPVETPPVQAVIEIDKPQNRLIVEAVKSRLQDVGLLVRVLDDVDNGPNDVVRLATGTREMYEIARRLEPVLPALVDLSSARNLRGFERDSRLAFQPPALERQPLPVPQPGGQQQPGAPPESSVVLGINPGAANNLPQIVANLRGNVSVEVLPDLGVLILRGNEADVKAVMDVVNQIEKLSEGVTPNIHLLKLKHVNSEALAQLLNSVYEQLNTLRSQDRARVQSVNVIPVVKPNAVLILAPDAALEAIIDLAEELDQPVDPAGEFQVFRLKYAIASQVSQTITDFYTERAPLGARVSVAVDARTNSLIVQARPNDLDEIARLVRKLDRVDAASVNQVRFFPLENAIAEELAEVLNSAIQSVTSPPTTTGQLGAGAGAAGAGQASQALRDAKSVVLEFFAGATPGDTIRSGILVDIRITAEPRTNKLIVTAPAKSMDLVAAIIKELDQATSTVADIKVFTLENADATAAVTLLETLFEEQTQQQDQLGVAIAGAEGASSSLVPLRFSTDPRTNSVLAVGGAEALRVVEAILLRLDESDVRERRTIVVRLQNSPVTEVALAINTFLQSQRDLAQIDPELVSTTELLEREIVVVPEAVTNNLLISATPRYFDEIRRIVRELDAPPAQVMIQALLVEVELQNTDELGVELGFQDSVLFDRSEIATDSFLSVANTVTNQNIQTTTQQVINSEAVPGFAFNNQPLGNNPSVNSSSVGTQQLTNFALGRTNGDLGFGGLVLSASSENVSVLIRALAARRTLHILSRPQVRTLDNQLAQIQVGQVVPRVNGVTITNNFANPNVQDTNVGIILTVTPRINPDGTIIMETIAEKSQLSGIGIPIFTDPVTGAVTESPIIDITTARTVVAVPNGQTVIIGGMITKNDDTIERKVPWLGDIPLLGTAFRYDGTSTRRTELLIFLTPRILHDDADSELVKQVEAERLHFIERDAERLHGPLYAVPPDAEFGGNPYAPPGCDPALSGPPIYGPEGYGPVEEIIPDGGPRMVPEVVPGETPPAPTPPPKDAIPRVRSLDDDDVPTSKMPGKQNVTPAGWREETTTADERYSERKSRTEQKRKPSRIPWFRSKK